MKHVVFFICCLPLFVFAQKKENTRNRAFAHYGELFHDSVPSLGAVIIWRNDEVLLENYFNGTSDTTLFKVKSITKTITSTLAGIAKDKGLLPALVTPVSTLFPEYTFPAVDSSNRWFPELMTDTDSLRKLVTIQHLLTMQTGYLWDDQNPLSHRVFLSSSDPVRHMLELPFESVPGTTFKYCTGASHLMGAVIEKSVHQPLNEFAEQKLFTPLGITTYDWSCDARGRTTFLARQRFTAIWFTVSQQRKLPAAASCFKSMGGSCHLGSNSFTRMGRFARIQWLWLLLVATPFTRTSSLGGQWFWRSITLHCSRFKADCGHDLPDQR
jgi:Beta-lactamase